MHRLAIIREDRIVTVYPPVRSDASPGSLIESNPTVDALGMNGSLDLVATLPISRRRLVRKKTGLRRSTPMLVPWPRLRSDRRG